MPGVQVKWSADARDALREVTDAYLRRRAKARIEKYARSRKIPVITCQLALPMIEETVGRDKLGAGWDTLLAKTKFEPAAVPAAAPAAGPDATTPSPFAWTEDAVARLNRVPAGFMRDMTREEMERVGPPQGRDDHRSRGVRGRDRARAADHERGHRGVRVEQEAALADGGARAPVGRGSGDHEVGGRVELFAADSIRLGCARPGLGGKRVGGPPPTGAPRATRVVRLLTAPSPTISATTPR